MGPIFYLVQSNGGLPPISGLPLTHWPRLFGSAPLGRKNARPAGNQGGRQEEVSGKTEWGAVGDSGEQDGGTASTAAAAKGAAGRTRGQRAC